MEDEPGVTLRRERGGLQGIDRLVRIFEAVAAGPAPLSKIASESGLSDATTLRYLGSLVSHGLLERDPDSRLYRMGMRMFLLGRSAIGGRDFMAVATSAMAQLVDQIDETVNFGARVGVDLVIVRVLESSQPIRMGAAVGDKDRWHSSGLGKAILSTLPAEEIGTLLTEHGMAELTPRTLITPEDLLRDLARARTRGFATDDEESVEGLRCAAAPIRDARGTARYALSVSAPAYRLPHSRLLEVGEALRAQAEVLEALLDHAPAGPRADAAR
ncbi:IclR family transcriptional regulator domain-containing protein [Actinopolymorpha pittospori]|uniref:IclR family acetate operon transcriptional repressor n=1 Tax=Actinopolymorpha pittospori TaxID=648752 RepID=A0A927MP91_9ACTN|nr:IclR family acetate operon transcriptional repressor [Actinopolymorpha pittospori]